MYIMKLTKKFKKMNSKMSMKAREIKKICDMIWQILDDYMTSSNIIPNPNPLTTLLRTLKH